MTDVLAPHRRVLALPGVARLLLFAVLARAPFAGAGVILTLHVVTGLHRGYGAAGLVALMMTVGIAIGGPWRGRVIDRLGLRRALVPSILWSTLAWALSPLATFGQLLVLSLVGGLLAVPVFAVTRQSLAVLLPASEQRTGFALDSIGTEVSFIVGPPLGLLLATQISTRAAIWVFAGLIFGAGLGLLLLNPPLRSAEAAEKVGRGGKMRGKEPVSGGTPGWFSPGLAAVLAAAVGATLVLSGSEVAIIARLVEDRATSLTSVAFIVWSLGSMIGGVVYGGLRRSWSAFKLLFLLSVFTIPVGWAVGPWVLMAALIPSTLACAPVLAATAQGVSLRVPEEALGEAMGWYGSALQVGAALGAPLAGVMMDRAGAWSGFAVVGVAGSLIALVGLGLVRRRGRPEAARVRVDSVVGS